ncbi:response regulator [Phenylobacterium sp.]|uniref:response regulator n=1 Tax=Phenylobacterium sp. TaxID=1871053 RepID=UPI003BA87151
MLIVEDEFLIAEGLRLQVEDMGLTVCAVAATAEDAISLAQAHRPYLVLMDMRLRGLKDGVDAALAINATVGSKMIFVTGSREPATMERIQMDHPSAVLFKPVSDRQLQATINGVLAG